MAHVGYHGVCFKSLHCLVAGMKNCLSNQAVQMIRCLSIEKDQEEMKRVSLCLLVMLYTCMKQYNYNHAWYNFENCEWEILWLLITTVYGEWDAWLHDRLHPRRLFGK